MIASGSVSYQLRTAVVHTCRYIGLRAAVLHYSERHVFRTKQETLAREVLEAYPIQEKGNDCVSVPSITLYKKEYLFLGSAVR